MLFIHCGHQNHQSTKLIESLKAFSVIFSHGILRVGGVETRLQDTARFIRQQHERLKNMFSNAEFQNTQHKRNALQAGRSRVRFPMVSLEFFIYIIHRPHYSPGVDPASNRNEYQEYILGSKGGLYVGLTTLLF